MTETRGRQKSDSPKKLWRVDIEVDMVVLAVDADEAKRVAADSVEEEIGNRLNLTSSASLVNSMTDIDRQWADSYPYGGEADHTCSEIVSRS